MQDMTNADIPRKIIKINTVVFGNYMVRNSNNCLENR